MTKETPHGPSDTRVLRINTSIRGELAEFAFELQKRGFVRNIPDLVSQSLRALQDRVTERELAKARLDAIKNARGNQE